MRPHEKASELFTMRATPTFMEALRRYTSQLGVKQSQLIDSYFKNDKQFMFVMKEVIDEGDRNASSEDNTNS